HVKARPRAGGLARSEARDAGTSFVRAPPHDGRPRRGGGSMKTWVLGAVMVFPALSALVACGGGGGAKCAGQVVDNVCVPSTTGTGGSGSSGTGGHAS